MEDQNSQNDGQDDQPLEIDPSLDGSQLDELNAQLNKAKSDYLYLRADFDNFKKSAIKERADLIKYGSERIIVELLDVMDNFERALQTELTPETITNYKAGIELTVAEMKKAFSRFGVVEVNCEGAAFDPTAHEALSSEETDRVPAGHISRVFKKAYKLHDRLVRPAQVVVAKEPKSTTGDM